MLFFPCLVKHADPLVSDDNDFFNFFTDPRLKSDYWQDSYTRSGEGYHFYNPDAIIPSLRSLDDYIIEYYYNPEREKKGHIGCIIGFFRWGISIHPNVLRSKPSRWIYDDEDYNQKRGDFSFRSKARECFSHFGLVTKLNVHNLNDDAASYTCSDGTRLISFVDKNDYNRVAYMWIKEDQRTSEIIDLVIVYPKDIILDTDDKTLVNYRNHLKRYGLVKANLYGRDHWWSRR